VVWVIVVRIAMVRIAMVLVGGGMVLVRTLTFPLVLGSVRPLSRVPTQALRRLPPSHGICDESYLHQRSADAAGKSGKCGDEFVCESLSFRMLQMPLSAPTKLFPLTTEASDSSESVRQTVISELL